MSSRFFDLLNSITYDLKRSVDLRWLFDPVLHSSSNDLVVQDGELKTVSLKKANIRSRMLLVPFSKIRLREPFKNYLADFFRYGGRGRGGVPP